MKKVFVRALPSPERVAEVKDLLALGFTDHDIVAKVFGPKDPGGHCLHAVRGINADPDLYDTDVDEIAVDRALQGDRAVWEALTHYERREVMLAVHARRELERAENVVDRSGWTGSRWSRQRGWLYVAPNPRNADWVQNLAEMIGWDAGRLRQEAKGHFEARVL